MLASPSTTHPYFIDRDLAQELKRDVPGFRRTPAQAVPGRSQTLREHFKCFDHFGGKCNPGKQPHIAHSQVYLAKDSICFT